MESSRITLRIAPEAVATINRLAAQSGITQSDFIRDAIEAHTKRLGDKVSAGVPKAGTYERKGKSKT